MLSQRLSFSNRHPLRSLMGLALAAWLGVFYATASAMYAVDQKTINAALVYGMRNHKMGLSNVLGANWIENADGALLNIYTPFMVLATKASRANLSRNPTASDLQKARDRFARDLAYYGDSKNRFRVKFSVSFYGDSADFAKHYIARIEGVGRGKRFSIKPVKEALDQIADPLGAPAGKSDKKSAAKDDKSITESGNSEPKSDDKPSEENVLVAPGKPALYEAINSYYFEMSEIIDLQEFQFIMESPTGKPITFRVNNERVF